MYCTSVNLSVKVRMLRKYVRIAIESKIIYGNEVWGFTEVWEELDKVNSRFCKKLIVY